MTPGVLPLWVEIPVAALLLASGVLSLIGAVGLLRLKSFFQRMHPPALASTIGTWCVALASIAYFSMLQSRWVLHAWLIAIFLAITAPVTTTLLARAALFRKRAAEADVADPAGDRTPH
jgi:multicomponent K+:H+ antiporter subunit G